MKAVVLKFVKSMLELSQPSTIFSYVSHIYTSLLTVFKQNSFFYIEYFRWVFKYDE